MVLELPLVLGVELEPLVLGELVAPLLLGELLGVLLLGVLLLGVLLAPPTLLPVAPLLEPDLKWSSHSEREIWPSPFLSTAENSGAVVLPAPLDMPLEPTEELPLDMPLEPADELPLDEVSDEPVELLPVALGEEPEAPVVDEPELCAMETLASAKSAAAVAVLTSFSIG